MSKPTRTPGPWRVVGIEDSDGDRCECCGTPCPKRRIVLDDGNATRRFGSSCAALAVLGKKSRSNLCRIEAYARANSYAAKWISQYGKSPDVLSRIASAIRVRFCDAHVRNGELVIGGDA
jgi:hypothetical protein